jgi:DNA modification methylase
MCGQSYLDAIMAMMGEHLDYYWTGCYLTPGQSASLRQKQVNTQWKPILIYGLPDDAYKGKIFGDVWVSDGNDKDLHKWGQSESGMYEMVNQVCLPGQSIMDPFCGAGTTGVAALRHGCLFRGVELDATNAGIARARLAEATE